MEIEYIKKEHGRHRSNHHWKFLVFVIFLGVFSFVIYTSFYGDFDFTGNIIQGSDSSQEEKSIQFQADLTIPQLSIEGNFDRIELRGNSGSFLQVGDQRFYLGNVTNNYITLNEYDGEIAFNEEKISVIEGKATGVIINGILVTSQTKETTKITFENSLSYDLLEMGNEVSIKKISYVTSGLINVEDGKNAFVVNEEQVTINDFKGSIQISNKKFRLDGQISDLEILGNKNVNIKV
ncbi:hypothetical protein J4407_01690 [Candidatus Pacearchaeota archaeon]|nr:hypothetical protein [Candidatus Pacearchaeota archaeon]